MSEVVHGPLDFINIMKSYTCIRSIKLFLFFRGNIPGNDISKGEQLCDYLQVFPVKGTGFHRYVFILFKQEQQIDFRDDRLSPNT